MKQKLIFPIAFSLLLTSFTAFSVLDTFVLQRGETVEVDEDDENDFFKKNHDDGGKELENDNKTPVEDNKPPEEDESQFFKGDKPKQEDNKPETENKETSKTNGWDRSKVDTDPNYLHSYIDENLNIKIFKETIKTKHMTEDRMMDTVVFCADVKISSAEHIRTRFAKASWSTKPTYGRNITNYTSSIAVDGGAIFAINGDYYGAREKGYVVRNGKTYRDTGYSDFREDLVIYGDGSFGIFDESKTKLSDVTSNELGAWQVFSFGPALVKDKKVSVEETTEVATFSKLGNQRCSIGIFEPLHYFIAICEGRLMDSYGMSLYEMGSFMKDKGVETAYNLDGGGSATIWFNGEVLNRPNTNGDNDIGERKISDIIFFK